MATGILLCHEKKIKIKHRQKSVVVPVFENSGSEPRSDGTPFTLALY